jgi:hypothetical protein
LTSWNFYSIGIAIVRGARRECFEFGSMTEETSCQQTANHHNSTSRLD